MLLILLKQLTQGLIFLWLTLKRDNYDGLITIGHYRTIKH
jgi:hypothetical protein